MVTKTGFMVCCLHFGDFNWLIFPLQYIEVDNHHFFDKTIDNPSCYDNLSS